MGREHTRAADAVDAVHAVQAGLGDVMTGDITTRHLKDGSIIFKEGDAPDGMYVILGGKVRVFRETHGHETQLAVLKQGDFFGDMAVFEHKPRAATAQTIGDVDLRYISGPEFEAMISDPFVRQMLTKMSERLRRVDEALTKLDAENGARHSYLENLSIHREWAV